MRQETFGPILPVIRVRDEEEAVARANAGGPALFASVWTGDRRRGEAVAMRLKAGGVSVNDVLSHWSLPGLPVGGTGESGFGFSRGTWGLREFSRRKAILVDRGGRTRDPWWYPYTAGSLRLTRAATSWRRHGGLRGMVAGVWRILRGGDP
jgi:acyl-CoA reductase-like NAD-dependent aldehyde dehydrogenase